MATQLIDIFNQGVSALRALTVSPQPRQSDSQYTGYPGAHGVTRMHLGTRGRQLVITGRLARSGSDYDAARSNLQEVIDAIEEYLWSDAADYDYKDDTYTNVVFDKFQLVPGREGKVFHFTSEGLVTADFVVYARCLI